jgi:7-cyano-7-deazaguanine synthase
MTDTPAVVVVSGGMDSVTLAHYVRNFITTDVHGISFNYGQKHKKELDFAAKLLDVRPATAEKGARVNHVLLTHEVVDLSKVNKLISTSSLTSDDIEVPDGHYAAETMKDTVVPNRNMIMLAIAAGYAVNIRASAGVWIGTHGGDHFIYPDCRPGFIGAANNAVVHGNDGFIKWIDQAVNAPFLNVGKEKIVEFGTDMEVDYKNTWSCYKGGENHCGRCGTCVERKEAFRLAKVDDPTKYDDEVFGVEAYRG